MAGLAKYVQLERAWAEFNELHPANMVVCNSGTAALHLSFEVVVRTGDYVTSPVVMPDYTMIACPRAATLAGLPSRFVDCDDRLLMDDGEPFGDATVDPYSALLAVHVYGRTPDMAWLTSTSGACHPVVEDLAEAHGVRPHPDSDAACWSFYKNKIVAGEEGGAVWFRDREHAARARQLRSLGFTEAHDYRHIPRGHNYRLADCLAGLVLDSLKKYPRHYQGRREAEACYDALCPSEWRMPPRDAPWVYDVRVPGLTSGQRYEVVSGLNRMGVAARHGFVRMSEQEEYKNCRVVRSARPDVTGEVFYLPLTLRMDRAGYAAIFDYVRKVVGA